MKKTIILTLLICASLNPLAVYGQRGETFTQPSTHKFEPVTPDLRERVAPVVLSEDIVQNVYVSPGYVTYLDFPKDSSIKRVDVGSSAMVDIKVDNANNAILLFPLVMQGHTNMTVLLDESPYVFEIYVRNQGEINQRVTYTTLDRHTKRLRFGPPLNPKEIDVNKFIQLVETYGRGLNSYPEHERMLYKDIGKVYTWNDSLIYLSDAFAFPKENMVVLRISRRNVSANANYLHVDQIKPFIANTNIPVTAAIQSNPLLYPGQMEKVYLFIQGYNLFANNDWRLQLPPEASQLPLTDR